MISKKNISGGLSKLYKDGLWEFEYKGKIINSKKGTWTPNSFGASSVLLFPDGSAIDLNHVFVIVNK